MSNLLHKVKDVFSGHHHGSGNKTSSQESYNDPNARDTYNSGDNLGSNTNAQDYGGNDYNARPMTSGDNYDAPGYTSGAYQDTRMPKQAPTQMPNQAAGQMTNQMPYQAPNQAPNQMSNQAPAQTRDQMADHMYDRMPDRAPDHMEGTGQRYEASGLESENRGAGYEARGQQDPNIMSRGNETGDAYDQPNMRRENYDSGGNMESANRMENETGPSDLKPVHDIYSSNELSSGAYKIKKDPDNYGATNMGSSSGYDATTRTGDYGSDIGPHLYEPPLGGNGLDEKESDVREPQGSSDMSKESQSQGTYGDPMGQTRSYTSDYGRAGENTSGNTHGYNTRSKNPDSSMADQVEIRAENEANQRMGQQGFEGSAAGGSSYNAPEQAEPESGGHRSNLLNKLDPRVRSSDFEDSAVGSQRGN